MSHNIPIQVVDEHDQIIGADLKSVVHSKGQYHRLARVLLFDQHGRVLLQKRTQSLSIWPGRWDTSAAGHVDFDENYETTAMREMKEEIGVETKLERVAIYKASDRHGEILLRRFTAVFKASIDSNTTFILQPDEVSEVRWFDKIELGEMIKKSPESFTQGVIDTYKYI